MEFWWSPIHVHFLLVLPFFLRVTCSTSFFPFVKFFSCLHHLLSMQKTKLHKVLELDCPKVDIVTRKGRATKSPFRSPNSSAAGIYFLVIVALLISFIHRISSIEWFSVKDGDAVEVTVQGISESDVKTKEIEVPLIIGLKAIEGIYQDDKEMLKLMRDQKKGLNDSAKDKNMVRKRFLSASVFVWLFNGRWVGGWGHD